MGNTTRQQMVRAWSGCISGNGVRSRSRCHWGIPKHWKWDGILA
ncbi:MAG: hypothetical protein ACRC42_00425 [Mycoplasma sp.]